MNKVGMAVDVSHCADQTTLDAFEASDGPVLITHSNCRAITPGHPRCKTDEAIKKFERIAETTPVPAIAKEADRAMDHLRNKKAESMLKIAEFYEKRKKYVSALYYCEDIVYNYPGTKAAKVAELKVEYLQLKAKK